VNVQLPYELDGQDAASIAINYNGAASAVKQVQISASAPRLNPSILNEDGSLNSPANPAPAGTVVALSATGQGATSPPSETGSVAVTPYPLPAAPVRVTVGGEDAEIVSAGLAPAKAGILQLSVRLPADLGGNPTVTVYLFVGDATSQQGVTLAVQ
jgi:uncharacterized protein (TIGR03437 family)